MKLPAYEYSLTLLSYNPKSVFMMRTTLLSKWYPLHEVDYAINKLLEDNYLNDHEFCKAYFTSEVINKWKSKRAIRKKMIEKWIPSDIVNDTLEDLDEEFTETTIPNLARDIQKLHKLGHDVLKIYEKLARKWHRYEDIKSALEYIKDTSSDTK